MAKKMLARLYLFFLPIVSVLNFSVKYTLPAIVSFLSFFILPSYKKIFYRITTIHYILIVFILNSFISLLLNISNIDDKMLNHQIALISVIVLFYFVPFFYISKISFNSILKTVTIVFFLSMFFSVFEFFEVNFLKLGLLNYVPRASVEVYEPSFLGLFIRSRSFFEESGHYASYLAVIIPFVYYYVFRIKNIFFYKALFLILVPLVILFVFSTALFLFLAIGIIILQVLTLNSKKMFKLLLLLLFFSSIIALFWENISPVYKVVIANKFQSNSYDDRYVKTLKNINLLLNSNLQHILWGYGLGSFKYLKIDPAISVYVNFLRDIGILGLLLLVFFNIYCFFYIWFKVRMEYRKIFTFSLLMITFFYLSIGNYFYPHFWIVYILLQHRDVRY